MWPDQGTVILYLHKAGRSLYLLIAGAGAGIRDKRGQEDRKWCMGVSITVSLVETCITEHHLGLMVVHQASKGCLSS